MDGEMPVLWAVRYTTLHAYFKTLHEFQSLKLYTPLYITLLYIKFYTAMGKVSE
jgi:hypothetical protein